MFAAACGPSKTYVQLQIQWTRREMAANPRQRELEVMSRIHLMHKDVLEWLWTHVSHPMPYPME